MGKTGQIPQAGDLSYSKQELVLPKLDNSGNRKRNEQERLFHNNMYKTQKLKIKKKSDPAFSRDTFRAKSQEKKLVGRQARESHEASFQEHILCLKNRSYIILLEWVTTVFSLAR